ncbi:MAG: hypothetical protein PWQ43_1658 [Rikenellaceae bacterium]|nr:hypothetical protein [Rikenellaceae bacterium]MDI3546204.1 hypothetical protein [Rikenellaceae bacterium]MDN5356714.1 hypothetical protein [Rikenellaceae bacterium]
MKNIQFLFILFCINFNAFSQKQLIFESGYFNCLVDNHIIYCDYMKDFDDGENILYTLNAYDLISGKNILIDSELLINNCIKLSDTCIIYAKNKDLIHWSKNKKEIYTYKNRNNKLDILGIGINNDTKELIEVQIYPTMNKILITIVKNKNIIFQFVDDLIIEEIEGRYPIIDAFDNFFVIQIQYDLYLIDLYKLELKKITDKCSAFAVYEKSIIYYEYGNNGKTEGYIFDPITNFKNKIDSQLSITYSAFNIINTNQNNIKIPYCIKMYKEVYFFDENKWVKTNDNIIIYKNDKYYVELYKTNDNTIKNGFIFHFY